MRYDFKCNNDKCEESNKVKTITCRMSEVSDPKPCECCKEPMVRVYNAPSISTGDGVKH